MKNSVENYKEIKGWGIDADPLNEPTYPMKNKEAEGNAALWERPIQQQPSVEILHSNERPNLSAVFGETIPPQGLSGALRRYAFKYSESRYRHWLPLLLADRINEIEGVVQDIKDGKFPNLVAERGWKARWQFGKKKILKDAAIGIGIGLAAYVLLKSKANR